MCMDFMRPTLEILDTYKNNDGKDSDVKSVWVNNEKRNFEYISKGIKVYFL